MTIYMLLDETDNLYNNSFTENCKNISIEEYYG